MTTARSVLTINGGSSSVKFSIFTRETSPRRVFKGVIERIGSSRAAAEQVLASVEREGRLQGLSAIGHRVVHGGPNYSDPVRLTPAVIDDLRRFSAFAPNHLPLAIELIDAFLRSRADVPHVACFDTAFHHQLPEHASTIAIPRRFSSVGVRRYGFHGLSYAFLMEELERVAGPREASGRVILAHLGNGVSLAAVHDRRCIDTSMGFTPNGGVVMGTRSGDLDPGVITYLLRSEGWSADRLDDVLTRESGLLGMSQSTADMRDLLMNEPRDPRCRLAVDVFCYQLKKWVGAFAAALGGVDTIIFSGGIGEHAPAIRERICAGLSFLGVRIDQAANASSALVISVAGSPVTVRVIPTQEDLMIARATCQIVGQ